MKLRILFVSCIASLGIIGMMAAVYGQRVTGKQKSRSAMSNVPSTSNPIMKQAPPIVKQAPNRQAGHGQVAMDAGPPPTWVDVDWELQLDANTLALYQQLATALNGYVAVPNDRLNYYSAVNNPPNFVINGWSGLLTNVQQNGNSYLVTVTVDPLLSTAQYGSTTVILSDYTEQYLIDNLNNVSYVGFLDPNGWAGQMPPAFITP